MAHRVFAFLALASSVALASAPTAVTNAAAPVTATTAQLNGSGNPGSEATVGWFRLSTTTPGTCNDTFGSRVPSSGGTNLSNGSVSVPFSVSATGLLPGNLYFYCAITQNPSGTTLGNLVSFNTPALIPAVATAAATSVTSGTATFNGSADPNGSPTTGFFRYSTSSPGSCNSTFGSRWPASGGTSLGGGNGSVAFTEVVTGLLAGTTYYYCAQGLNSVAGGPGLGNLLSFTTLVAVPDVTTTTASSITGFTANLNGTVNANGAATSAWFRMSPSNPGSCSDVFGTRVPGSGGTPLSGSTPQNYQQPVTGLSPGTTYFYCSIAQNSQGTTLGNVLTFTTPDVPTVNATAVSALTPVSVTLNGSGNPNGAAGIGWLRYSSVNPGVCSDSFGTRLPATAGTGTNLPVGSTTAFAQITGNLLLPGTTYYYCALASNSVGTGLSSLQTFTTPPALPQVTTNSTVTLATSTSGTLNGSVVPRGAATTAWFRYSTVNPGASCNDTFGTRAPASGGSSMGAGNNSVPYSNAITGLTPSTLYYYCAIAQNSEGLAFGAVYPFTTPDVPLAVTTSASSLTGTSATLNGTGDPNLATATGYFRFSTTNPGTCNDSFGTRAPASSGLNLGNGSSAQPYGQSISGLTPGTTYFYCAIVTNAEGMAFGDVLSFVTIAVPSMSTLTVSLLTATTASLNASANPNGATTTAWIRYSTVNPGFCDDTFGTRAPATVGTGVTINAGTAPVNYSYGITGLIPGTTYYWCAIGSNLQGTGFGSPVSFTTPPLAPTVVTSSPTLLTGPTATLNGSANPRGAATTGWFRYSTVSPGTCDDVFGTRVPATGGTALIVNNSSQAFSEPITGLVPGTTYYVCALANNVIGTSVGAVVSFLAPNVPTVISNSVTSLVGTSATLNGNVNANGATALAWMRYSATNPGSCDDSFGTRVPASSGSSIGAFSGLQAYSFGTNTLVPGTTYFWCAIASNVVGTGFGAVQSFITPATPTVTTDAVTALAATTVTLNGTSNPNNAGATGWFRYNTVSPGTCNDSFGTRIPLTGINLGGGAAGVPFSQALTGLLPGTTYFVCAISSNLVGTGVGAPLSFTTLPMSPQVTTNSASAITSSSATIQGTVTARGAASTAWFRYDTVSPGTCNDSFGFRVPFTAGTAVGSANTATPYTEGLTGLSLATTYYYCAISQNAVGTSFGTVGSFTTTAAPPAVTTLSASNITTTGASMNASATPNGAPSTGWFRYSTTNPTTCNDSFGTRAPASGGTDLGSGISPVPFSVTPATLTTGATYYFCAIASNARGTSFGSVLTFQTTPTAPTLNTLSATAIGGTTATLNGSSTPNGAATTGWFRYATTNPVTCNDTFGTRAPAASGTDLGTGVTAMPFSQALTGLIPGSTYYFCAIAQNSLGTVFGLVLSFATPAAPTIVSNAASPVGANSATLNATGTANGSAATGWFRYSTTSPGTCDDSFGTRTPLSGGTTLNTNTNFAAALSGLSPGTAYYFCAIGSNLVGMSFGSLLSFTTPPAAPSVQVVAANNFTATTATLNGIGIPNGASTTGYFRYATVSPGTCSDAFGTRAPSSSGTDLGMGISPVNYSQVITGLTAGTTYYFCPLAQNSVATSPGGVLSFTTPSAPTVTTTAASSILSTTAQLNGSATPNLDAATGWFRFATVSPGTCNDSFGTRAPATGGTALGAGSSGVAFNQAITGLSQGTTYYFCAIASNAVATSVGTVQSFTTTNAPTPLTLAASGVTGTSATLNGSTNPNGLTATGFFRYSTVDPGSCTSSFGTRAPTSSGTALGLGTSPVAHTQTIAVSAGTTYYYCAQGTNSAGTGLGNLLTFTTPGAPSVTTTPVTGIGTTFATLEGTASPNGATATGYFRYGTTNPGTCSDSFGFRFPASGGSALGAGFTAVPFTQALTGLAQGTTYFVCAAAINAQGTRFGAPVSFSTSSAPVVTTSAATFDSTSATLNGAANPRSDATTGWFRYSTTTPTTCNDSFGTRLPASGGTSLGAGSSAAPYTEALTGLTPGTQYFFCALASNSFGTSVGTVLSFTTTAAPLVTTGTVTALGGTTATLNGTGDPNGASATGYFRYSTTNPGTCDDTFGTRTPGTGGTALGAGTAAVPFSSAITGLTSLTTYFYCAIVTNAVGTTLGTVQSFTTPSAPVVTTVAASSVSSTAATLNGSSNPNGLTAIGYFRYALTDPGTCNDSFGTRAPTTSGFALGAGSAAVAHTQALTGLTSGSTYYFCAIASNAAGVSFGAVMSFTTPGLPVVTTLAATLVTSSAASLNGEANPAGSPTTGYFRYDTVSPGTCNLTFGTRFPASGGTTLGAGFTVAPFTEAISGLSAATTYYYCAIAQNGVGNRLGAVLSFTTAAGPAVATSAASAVTGTSATLNGSASPRGLAATGWYRYAAVNPGTCNDSFGTRLPASGGTALGAGTAAVGFVENVTGLTPGTTYYFCALASNSAGTSNGSIVAFTTPGPPSVTSVAASGISSTGATLNGSVTANTAATTGWFRYSTTNPGTCDDSFGTRSPVAPGGLALGTATTPISYLQPITGLSAGTTYFFCAIAQNSFGTRFGNVLTFATPAPPVVTTLAASAVAGTSATLNGTANPNASVTTGWFRYSQTNPGTCSDLFGTRTPSTGGVALGSGTTAAPYSATLTGLTPGATYFFCALASNTIGTSFGTPQSFTAPAAAPVVLTTAATLVTGSSAQLNGTANPGGAVTTGWFRYATTNPGTCSDTFGTRAPSTAGSTLGNGTAAVAFNQAVTGLMAGTTYFFCAIAQNSAATSFGSVQTFITPGAPGTVTTLAATGITGNSATLPGSANPNGGVSSGWFRYSQTDPGTCNDTFGTRAPTTGGTALGGGFTVTNFQQTVFGLTPGRDYFFCAIASNVVGLSVGAVQTFHTPEAPTVMTSSATNVVGGLARLNGGANPNGAATTGWFRYSPFDPGACNDSFGTRTPASGGTTLGAGMTSQSYAQNISGLAPGVTYFFCAIASNLVGTEFGDLLSFTVEAPLPTVRTLPSTDLETREATLNGAANPAGTAAVGWFRYSTTMPASCDDTFGTRVPATGGMSLGMGTADAPFSVALTGLKPGVTYYVCALASNMGGAAFGTVVTFKTANTTPTVRTAPATLGEDGSATLNGAANSSGMPGKAWFLIGRERPIVCTAAFGEKVPPEGLPLGDSESEVPLAHVLPTPEGTFYYCAVAETGGGTVFGDVQTFTIAPVKQMGCGCGVGAESATLFGFLLVLLSLTRKRERAGVRV